MLDHGDHGPHAGIGEGRNDEAPAQPREPFHTVRPGIETGPDLVQLVAFRRGEGRRQAVLLQQLIQRLAIDAIHPEPRPLPGDDLVQYGAIELAPIGRQEAPVDLESLGPVDGGPHAQQRPAEIGTGALDVEGERPDIRQ